MLLNPQSIDSATKSLFARILSSFAACLTVVMKRLVQGGAFSSVSAPNVMGRGRGRQRDQIDRVTLCK